MNKLSRKRVRKQKGLTLVLVTLAMVVLLGFSALAIDVNHALLNKTRLQNAVDTAALSAAVLLDSGNDENSVRSSIFEAISNVTAAEGNTELSVLEGAISITFSNDPLNFDGTYNHDLESYVRVAVSDVPLSNYFLSFFGINKLVSASAVAGPSSSITHVCNVVPMAVCASTSSGSGDFLGYNYGEVYALKMGSTGQSEMVEGNFQLLDFGSGANTIRTALAGGFEGCVDLNNDANTKPGGTVGPVGQGLNTRFGDYSSSLTEADYPSDINVKEPGDLATIDSNGNVEYTDSWGYEDYKAESEGCVNGSGGGYCRNGEVERRVLSVPMVNCATPDDSSGGGVVNYPITSIGCFFLIQKAPTSNSGQQAVFGEFIEDCTIVNGSTGIIPSNEGAYKIQLYKDPLSEES